MIPSWRVLQRLRLQPHFFKRMSESLKYLYLGQGKGGKKENSH